MPQFISQACTAPASSESSQDDAVVPEIPAPSRNDPDSQQHATILSCNDIFTGYQSEDGYSAKGSYTEPKSDSEEAPAGADQSDSVPTRPEHPATPPSAPLASAVDNDLSFPSRPAPPLKRCRLDVPARTQRKAAQDEHKKQLKEALAAIERLIRSK